MKTWYCDGVVLSCCAGRVVGSKVLCILRKIFLLRQDEWLRCIEDASVIKDVASNEARRCERHGLETGEVWNDQGTDSAIMTPGCEVCVML